MSWNYWKNLKVHPIFHISFLKPIACDASRPNQEYNSRPSPNLIDNELEFEMEVVLKPRQLRVTRSQAPW
jgi:hypothetical protein